MFDYDDIFKKISIMQDNCGLTCDELNYLVHMISIRFFSLFNNKIDYFESVLNCISNIKVYSNVDLNGFLDDFKDLEVYNSDEVITIRGLLKNDDLGLLFENYQLDFTYLEESDVVAVW